MFELDPAPEEPSRHQGERLVRLSLGLFFLSLILRLVHLAAMATPQNVLLDPTSLDTDPKWIHQQAFRVIEEGLFPDEAFPHGLAFCYVAVAVYGAARLTDSSTGCARTRHHRDAALAP